MERRQFLGLAAGAGVSALAAGCSGTTKKADGRRRVGIVGGGILGAAIAMHAARAGADVTLLEKTEPAAGATSKSLAWINPFIDDPHYMALRLDSIKRWHAIDREIGTNIVWGGYVGFTDREEDRGRMKLQDKGLAAAGFPTRSIDAVQMKKIAPDIDPGHLVEATFSELGGHLDPVHGTNCYLDAARAAGAQVLFPCPVNQITPGAGLDDGVDVDTPQGKMHFDRLVVVAGVDAPGLLAPLGYKLPLLYRPGALVHSKPMPFLTKHVYDGPSPLEWKQAADGSVVGLEASIPPNIPAHAAILSNPMDFPPGIAEMHGTRILSKFAVYQPALQKAEFGHMTIGFRPFPVDDRPVVGPVPGVPAVSMCVTHSGVTLAAVLGFCVAEEIVRDKPQDMLSRYRPDRTFGTL